MNVILLAAGTSTRMGSVNKLLIPVNGISMVSHCALQALEYLASLKNEHSELIIVTGYRHVAIDKALLPCREFIEKTDSELRMTVVCNREYRLGQFSSVKTGLGEIDSETPFFIALADMPFITSDCYARLSSGLGNFDAVRPVVGNVPGHPVLMNTSLKDKILRSDAKSVSEVLKKCNVNTVQFEDKCWIRDIDSPEDTSQLTV